MRSQPISLIATQRSSVMSLVIVLVAMFFVSCASSQPSQSAASPSPSPALTKSDALGPKFLHDIPPEIVIDVGSFNIETDKSITNGAMAPTKRGTYKIPNKDVLMMLIKVIRTDDGAILYQNFDANGAEVEFTTTTAGDKKITIKPGVAGGKKTVEFESWHDENLAVQRISPPINRREYRLHNATYTIKNVTVKKGNVTLFSHDTLDKTPDNPEYSDKKYKVFIRVEY